MLKKLLALSDQGACKLRHGIVATTIGHLCIMAPISILMMVTMGLLEKICGDTGLTINAYSILMMAVAFLLLIFITQWIQYNLTYKVAYEESANRRITLAEKLRRLPLSFFGQRDLSDLTTTMMGDCSKLERIFSNAVPSLFGTVIMFMIVAAGLLVMDWRMGLCIVLPVPVAALILVAARRTQTRAENRNYDAHRAAYDGVQEYLDAIQELRSAGLEQEYLDGVEKKLGNVVKSAFRNELAPGTAVTLAQLTVRFGLVAVLLIGGLLVVKNALSINMFILYLLVAGRVYEPFGSCFMLMAELFSAFVSIGRTKEMEATVEQKGQPVCRNKGYVSAVDFVMSILLKKSLDFVVYCNCFFILGSFKIAQAKVDFMSYINRRTAQPLMGQFFQHRNCYIKLFCLDVSGHRPCGELLLSSHSQHRCSTLSLRNTGVTFSVF